jgi:hypothetical protein
MQQSRIGTILRVERWFLISLGTVLLCLGVSGVSLWIDEAYSARLAVQPTISAWFSTLDRMQGSDSQMPGYYLYLWAWARLFGASEIAMRLANVPWALLFTASLAWGVESILKTRRIWLLVCLSPFVLFYMNEARPYAMMMGLSMVTTVAVFAFAKAPERFSQAPWWAMISLSLLWSTHMLTIILAPSLLLLLLVMRPLSFREALKRWILPVFVTLPIFACLAVYYVRTLLSGKGGMIEKPGLPNLVFAFYDLLGFGGLGPPRNLLRQSHSLDTFIPYISSLALGILALSIAMVAILRHVRHSHERRTMAGLFVAFVSGLLFTLALSYAAHFRVLGRHMASFFPLFALLLITGLIAEWNRGRSRLVPFAILLLGIAWSVGGIRLRLLSAYQKDDYRDAAALAHGALAQGEPVLWLADREVAKYYGLRTTEVLNPGSVTAADATAAVSGDCPVSWLRQSVLDHPAVLVVMSNKPDIFDRDGKCQKTLDSLSTQRVAGFSAFDAWKVARPRD